MPIVIHEDLPAKEILEYEGISIINEIESFQEKNRPLHIVIFNIMPQKEKTETHLLRLLGNTPLQIKITFICPETHDSKTTSKTHIEKFYNTFSQIKHMKYDGMIITGAPVEHLPFEAVTYWKELKEILEWTNTNVTSTLHICWGAQAGLYFHYGINKSNLNSKCTGVFVHKLLEKNVKLVRGFDDFHFMPHSRNTDVAFQEIHSNRNLQILTASDEAGVCLVSSTNGKHIFLTGHPEYESTTLLEEYKRDLVKGTAIIPKNYFPEDNPSLLPKHTWRSHASLLFSNWLHYYVYQ